MPNGGGKVSKDQEEVDLFIEELVGRIVKEFAGEIDFIILFGSAAKGQFVKGASDIDLVVQLNTDIGVEKIRSRVNELFWEVDERRGMGFRTYLANGRAVDWLDLVFKKLENSLNLYTPVFVYGKSEMDWTQGRPTRPDLRFFSDMFISLGTVFMKFKKEGKVLYGRDVRKQIRVNLSWWERWKAICIPIYLINFSIVIWPLFPARAVKYTTKALLWGIESALIYAGELAREREQQMREAKKLAEIEVKMRGVSQMWSLFTRVRYRLLTNRDFELFKKAVDYKRRGFGGIGRGEAWEYVSRAWRMVMVLNLAAVLKAGR